jgi:signal transduction histidine kinase
VTLADDLRGTFLTEDLDDEQLAALIAVSEELRLPPGHELFYEGRPAETLWVLLDGEIELMRSRSGETVAVGKLTDRGQWAGGFTAWSSDGQDNGYRATGLAVTDVRVLAVPSAELGRLVGEWSPIAKHLLTGIYGTVRSIDATARELEKFVALGTNAARLAHELNNPAAASLRAVENLRQACSDMMIALARLAEHSISPDQYLELDRLRLALGERSVVGDSPIARMDREEAIGVWLDEHDQPDGWRIADTLAAAGVDAEWLDSLADVAGAAALPAALSWVCAAITATAMLGQLSDTTTRIGNLVDAAKAYSQMDRSPLQDVDVREGIDSTLAMLGSKLGTVTIERDLDPALPRIEAWAFELNQVWTNLIDNAVDAMDGRGTLTIRSRRDGDAVVVEIADTGHGIEPEALTQVFEPFFTTKGLTKGTGLGLDIARRIVTERHGGTIVFESRPGATTATVRLPIHRR